MPTRSRERNGVETLNRPRECSPRLCSARSIGCSAFVDINRGKAPARPLFPEGSSRYKI